MNACQHSLGDGSTLVVAADGCSLECTVCHEIVVELELQTIIFEVRDSDGSPP